MRFFVPPRAAPREHFVTLIESDLDFPCAVEMLWFTVNGLVCVSAYLLSFWEIRVCSAPTLASDHLPVNAACHLQWCNDHRNGDLDLWRAITEERARLPHSDVTAEPGAQEKPKEGFEQGRVWLAIKLVGGSVMDARPLLLSSIWTGHRLKAMRFQIENSGSGWLWFYCIVHYTGQQYTQFLKAKAVLD